MRIAWLAPLVSLLAACNPEFSTRYSRIDAVRVLGVQSTPAEGAPKAKVGYRLLVVGPSGSLGDASIDWAYCTQPKSVSESDDFSTSCLGDGSQVVAIGSGAQVTGTLPASACRQFGPDIPQTMPGQPPARPADPDATGGYYQPVMLAVRAEGSALRAFAETRLTCGLANSSGDQFTSYLLRTKPNENPLLEDVVALSLGNQSLSPEDAPSPVSVSPGTVVALRASWPSCPATPVCGDDICSPLERVQECPDDCTTPRGCRGPEPYAYLDPLTNALVDRHEAMRVSWFATAGDYADDHTGQPEESYAITSSDNTWTAPSAPGTVYLWVVLRDARGGMDWKSFRVDVQ